MAPSDVDFYKILQVTRHATDVEIKRSFHKLGMHFRFLLIYIRPLQGCHDMTVF
jgi:hypothetical protein